MPYIFLDIETIPLEIKNEEVKSYLIDSKIGKEGRIFNPLYSKVIVVGIKEMGKAPEIIHDENEKSLLEKLWLSINPHQLSSEKKSDVVIVTFNGYKFDIPFLTIRSAINGLFPSIQINTNRWTMPNSNHFDVMMFFSQYENFINPNLEILTKILDVDTSDLEESKLKGADIEKAYRLGKSEWIKSKCSRDLQLLEKIFKKACLLQ